MNENTQRFPMGFYALIAVQFLQSLSFYMIAPIFTKYLIGQGTSLAVAGAMSGLMSYTCIVMRPFSGILADTRNRRSILMLSSAAFGVSMMLYACVTSQIGYVLLRISTGIAFCLSGTTLFAFAGQFIAKERMGEGIGYVGMGHIVASAVGPLIGTTLSDAFSPRMAFVMAGAASLIAAAVLMLPALGRASQEAPTPEPNARPGARFDLRRWIALPLIPIACLGSLFSYTSSTVSNFLILYSDAKGIANAAVYFTVLAGALVLARPLLGKLNDRKGLSAVLIPGLLLSMAAVALMMSADGLPQLLAAAVLFAFGQGGAQPAVQAYCLKALGPDKRGVATSTYYIFNDVMQGVAPSLGGIAIQNNGYSMAFLICMGLMAAGLAYYLILLRHQRRKFGHETAAGV